MMRCERYNIRERVNCFIKKKTELNMNGMRDTVMLFSTFCRYGAGWFERAMRYACGLCAYGG